jgi:hypothetical protein
VDTEALLRRLSNNPECVAFAKAQRELLDASEAKESIALADFVASRKKSALDKVGLFVRKAVTMSKSDAGYVDGPVESQPCRDCSMFVQCRNKQDTNKCTLVVGDISARGHCDRWDEKK